MKKANEIGQQSVIHADKEDTTGDNGDGWVTEDAEEIAEWNKTVVFDV